MISTRKQVHSVVVDDTAVSVIHSNLLTIALLVRLHVEHVAQHELVDIIVVVEFQTLLDLCLDLLGEYHLVDELGLYIVLLVGKCHNTVVGQLVQLLCLHLTTLGYLVQPVLPDAVLIGDALLTVVVAHARLGVSLHIALIFAHLGYHIFDAKLVEKALIVFALAAKTLEVNHTLCVQIDIVGHRGHVVAGLIILVGIGHNPLAALLEIFQSIAQLLGCSGCVEREGTALQIDTLDIVVIFCLTNAGNQVVKAHSTHVTHAQQGIDG